MGKSKEEKKGFLTKKLKLLKLIEEKDIFYMNK